MGLLLVLLPTLAFGVSQTDEIGSRDSDNAGNEAFKLDTITVGSAVELDYFEVYLDPEVPNAEVIFALYEEGTGGGVEWSLLWDSGSVVTGAGEGFKSSGPINLTLESGKQYAVGVYLVDEHRYWWLNGGYGNNDQDIGWGVADGAYYTSNGNWPGGLPDPLYNNDGARSNSPYSMQITVILPDDNDGDGYNELDDCDDGDPAIHPGAEEACDEIDNDCDGDIDEDVVFRDVYVDDDGDGFGVDESVEQTCEPTEDGFADVGGDCDDGLPDVYPGAPEICDGVDSDCDGVVSDDERDGDGDGVAACDDCDDEDDSVYPDAPEFCGVEDKNCDGDPPNDPDCEEALIPGACSCQQGGPSGAPWLLLPLLFARRRR